MKLLSLTQRSAAKTIGTTGRELVSSFRKAERSKFDQAFNFRLIRSDDLGVPNAIVRCLCEDVKPRN